MIVESIGKEPILAIHYDDWNRYYDEFLPMSSPRLARLGFYTSRDDIPKYKMKSIGNNSSGKNQMQAFIVNRVILAPGKAISKSTADSKSLNKSKN